MSQAARRHVLRIAREHRQVARFIASTVDLYSIYGHGPTTFATPRGHDLRDVEVMTAVTGLTVGGMHFDVHAAREAAEDLVALEHEQAVFEDWCRDRGLGPDNDDHYAFRKCADCGSAGDDEGCGAWFDCEDDARGGWPGSLAREWAALGHDRRAPMGRSLARLGRAVLRAIAGQPSECPTCAGSGAPGNAEWIAWSDNGMAGEPPENCSTCHGTGHNIRGRLPPVVWPAVVRRKVIDANDRCTRPGGNRLDTWMRNIMHTVDEDEALTMQTRTFPRGEHGNQDTLLWRQEYVPLPADRRPDLLPSWLRGELRHAEQRRAREARRRVISQNLQLIGGLEIGSVTRGDQS